MFIFAFISRYQRCSSRPSSLRPLNIFLYFKLRILALMKHSLVHLGVIPCKKNLWSVSQTAPPISSNLLLTTSHFHSPYSSDSHNTELSRGDVIFILKNRKLSIKEAEFSKSHKKVNRAASSPWFSDFIPAYSMPSLVTFCSLLQGSLSTYNK